MLSNKFIYYGGKGMEVAQKDEKNGYKILQHEETLSGKLGVKYRRQNLSTNI